MAFWSAAGTEPRRNFKFLVTMRDLPVWIVKTVNLPEITVGAGEHKFLNHTFYFPGTVTYNEVSFTVVDAIDQDITKKILQKFVQTGYSTPGNIDTAKESLITKEDAVNRGLGNVIIYQLGNGGDGQDGKIGFELYNAWISKLTFPSSLDYGNEDLSEIQVSLKYDFFNFYGNDNATEAINGFGSN